MIFEEGRARYATRAKLASTVFTGPNPSRATEAVSRGIVMCSVIVSVLAFAFPASSSAFTASPQKTQMAETIRCQSPGFSLLLPRPLLSELC